MRERPDVTVTIRDATPYAANPANAAVVADDPRYYLVKSRHL
jgi:hypothetical protein